MSSRLKRISSAQPVPMEPLASAEAHTAAPHAITECGDSVFQGEPFRTADPRRVFESEEAHCSVMRSASCGDGRGRGPRAGNVSPAAQGLDRVENPRGVGVSQPAQSRVEPPARSPARLRGVETAQKPPQPRARCRRNNSAAMTVSNMRLLLAELPAEDRDLVR